MNTNTLATFKSHINGKNADVALYADRLEWSATKLSGLGKLAAVGSMGASLLAYRPQTNKGTEMIPLRQITSVITQRDGLMWTNVVVVTSSGTQISFRVSPKDADTYKNLITSAMLAVGAN